MKGCPYHKAVAETMFKVVKTEFTNGAYCSNLYQLEPVLNDDINSFNNIRIHGTLGDTSPVESRLKTLYYLIDLVLTLHY